MQFSSSFLPVYENKMFLFSRDISISLVGSEQYIRPYVSICIVSKSLSLVMTLKMVF